jgi:hypothetical protein
MLSPIPAKVLSKISWSLLCLIAAFDASSLTTFSLVASWAHPLPRTRREWSGHPSNERMTSLGRSFSFLLLVREVLMSIAFVRCAAWSARWFRCCGWQDLAHDKAHCSNLCRCVLLSLKRLLVSWARSMRPCFCVGVTNSQLWSEAQ